MSDVIQIQGNLTKIKLSDIEVADFAAQEDEFAFSNPRHFEGGRPGIDGKGFDRDSMNELRDAISDKGLFKPLMVRSIETDDGLKYQLFAGERRYRCCKKLAADDTPCFDTDSNEERAGSEVYEYVECRLYEDISDKDAMKMAFLENSTSVGIGETANYKLFCYWRDHGYTDEEIMETTKKRESWVRQMDRIRELDPETRDAYCKEEINQTVADLLADIPDKKTRLQILEKTCEFAERRAKPAIAKYAAAVEDVQVKKDLAEGSVEIAKFQNDDAKVAESEEEADKADEKLKEKKKQLNNAKRSQKARAADAIKAQKDVTGKNPESGRANLALRGPKIKQHYIELALGLIDTDGVDENNNVIATPRDLQLVVMIANAIHEGDRDLSSVMTQFYAEVEEVLEEVIEDEVADEEDSEVEAIDEIAENFNEDDEDYEGGDFSEEYNGE